MVNNGMGLNNVQLHQKTDGWEEGANCKTTHIKHRYFGQVLEHLPLPPYVVHRAHDDHMLQFVVVEVGGPEGHDQVPQANERGVRVGEEANHHVTIEDRHCRLVAVL